jgi:hypothetical protein
LGCTVVSTTIVDRLVALMVPLRAKVPAVRILDPALDDFFIAQRKDVLQVSQPRHEPHRKRRTARRRHELRTELPIVGPDKSFQPAASAYEGCPLR